MSVQTLLEAAISTCPQCTDCTTLQIKMDQATITDIQTQWWWRTCYCLIIRINTNMVLNLIRFELIWLHKLMILLFYIWESSSTGVHSSIALLICCCTWSLYIIWKLLVPLLLWVWRKLLCNAAKKNALALEWVPFKYANNHSYYCFYIDYCLLHFSYLWRMVIHTPQWFIVLSVHILQLRQ